MSKRLIYKTPNVKTPNVKTPKNKTSNVSKHLIFKTPNVKTPKNKTPKVSKRLIYKTPNVKTPKDKTSKLSKHLKTIHTKCQKGSNIQDFNFPSYFKIMFRYFCSKRMQHVGSVGISRNLFKSKMFTFSLFL